MDVFESVPEAKFREKVRRFAREHVAPVAQKVEEGMFPREILPPNSASTMSGRCYYGRRPLNSYPKNAQTRFHAYTISTSLLMASRSAVPFLRTNGANIALTRNF